MGYSNPYLDRNEFHSATDGYRAVDRFTFDGIINHHSVIRHYSGDLRSPASRSSRGGACSARTAVWDVRVHGFFYCVKFADRKDKPRCFIWRGGVDSIDYSRLIFVDIEFVAWKKIKNLGGLQGLRGLIITLLLRAFFRRLDCAKFPEEQKVINDLKSAGEEERRVE